MRVSLALTLGLFVLLAAERAPAQTWTPSEWTELGFAAEFPFEPSLDSSEVGDEGDTRTMMTVGASSEIGYFGVVVTALPEFTDEVIADRDARRRILDSAQSHMVADAGSKIKSQREISLAGRFGREIISTIPGEKAEIHTRIYLEAQRMYMQIAVVANKKILPTGKRFLNSFRFL